MPALILALLQLGVALEPSIAELLAFGIKALIKSIDNMNLQPTAVGTVLEIIKGIDKAHPEWSGAEKRDWVNGAVAQYIINHGGEPNERSINALIELALQAQGLVDSATAKV